jgi:hypothetical protein
VKRYLALFPREQIRIYWYEQDWRDPARLLRDLFQFPGVEASFEPDLQRNQRPMPTPAASPCEPRDSRFLVDYYAGDIRELAALLGRDLSSWLR